MRFLDDLPAGTPVHPVTVPVALRAGQIDGQLRAAGKSVALVFGQAVATGNPRHFALIPGLLVETL
jgi:predicted nucleic acid-binding protein